jgi:geranylgeranyl diphosphate synthase type 3
VDDVEDNSKLRRGAPGTLFFCLFRLSCVVIQFESLLVAHKIYGVPQTINTANYVYFQAFKEISVLQGQASKAVKDAMYNIVVGED